jgi:phage terminase large subunit-like protein
MMRLRRRTLVHDGDPLLARHMGNTAVKLTPAGPHIKKENPNSPRKIDAAVAAILAHDRASGKIEERVSPSFSVRGMSTVLQVAGMVGVTVGAVLLSVPVGLIVGGVFLLVVGFALGK